MQGDALKLLFIGEVKNLYYLNIRDIHVEDGVTIKNFFQLLSNVLRPDRR